MSRTRKDKRPMRKYHSIVAKNVKIAAKHKKKTFKNEEINNGNVLDRMQADRWDWD